MNDTAISATPKGRWLARMTEPIILLPAVAVIMLVLIWGTTLNLIKTERAAATATASVLAREQAENFEHQILHDVYEIDQILKFVRYVYEFKDKQVVLDELLAQSILPPDIAYAVSIVDSNGIVLASTRQSMLNGKAAEHNYLRRPLDVLLVGDSRLNLESGAWEMQFSRRLNAPGEPFAGYVMVLIDVSWFVSSYEEAEMGNHGVLGLLGTNGVFRVLRTGETTTTGDSVDFNTIVPLTLEPETGASLTTNAWDGVRRYTSASMLEGFPLAVIVGLSEAEQMAATEHKREVYLQRASSGSLLLVVVISVLGYIRRHISIERRRNAQMIADEKIFSNTLIASLPDGFCVFDADGHFIRWNDNMKNILGLSDTQMASTRALDTVYEADRPQVARHIHDVLERGAAITEARLVTKAGEREFSLSWARANTAQGICLISVATDITERKRAEAEMHKMHEQLHEQSLRDPLTGLYNRRYLGEAMQRELIRAMRGEHPICLVMCDIDHFKTINDKYGHLTGDEVLRVFAELLKSSARGSDIVCRYGGEEFLLLLPEMPLNTARQRTEQTRHALETMSIETGAGLLRGTASFGVAVFPQHGKTSDELIRAADEAMYEAKRTGRNRVVVYRGET